MQIISVEQRVYVGSVGVTINIECKNYNYEIVNLNTLKGPTGTAEILIKKPDGTVLTKTASIVGTNNDTLQYISEANDFDIPGIYYFQGKISNATTTIFTEPTELQVRKLFDEDII